MAIGGHNKDIVSRWTLDGSGFKRSATEIYHKIELVKQGMQALSAAMSDGFKAANLERNLKIPIEEAAAATKGLVDQMSLMQASSRASAFGLNLNSKEFANLAKAATIAAKRMGIDTNQAIGDMITGMARMSPKILDNLGIIVKADDTYRQYARTLGKNASKLTAVEKQTAFTRAAMASLNKIAADGVLKVNDLGGSFKQAEVNLKDLKTSFLGFVASIGTGDGAGGFSMIRQMANAFRVWSVSIDKSSSSLLKMRRSLLSTIHMVADSPFGKLLGIGYAKGAITAQHRALTGAIGRRQGLEGLQQINAQLKARFSRFTAPKGAGKKGRAGSGLYEGADPRTGQPGSDDTGLLANDLSLSMADREREIQSGYASKDRAYEAAKALSDHNNAVEIAAKRQAKLNAIQRQGFEQMRGMGVNALSQLASGMWAAADAAIAGGQGFGVAMAQMTKAALLSIAQQATAKALFQLAEGFAALFIAPPKAAAHFKSAALFGLAGVAAGTAGLAISAASSTSSGASAAAGAGASSGASSGVGRRETDREYKIVINQRYDPADRTTRELAARKLQARITRGEQGFATA
jgi:hypothetical protein